MILVTGATGFLGKRVCKKLDARKLEYMKTSLSMGVDLRDEEACSRFFQETKPEYVINCASYVGGIQFGMKHTAEIFSHNMRMITNLFEACSNNKVKRLINPISNCAYPGEATLFMEDHFWDGPLHESVMVYGMVRKMSYVASIAFAKQYGLDTINLILSNMYGPEDHFEEERSHALGALIMKIRQAKLQNKPSVVIWGTGKPVREWLHVDDGAEAMIRGMKVDPYSDIINIGVAKGISIWDMAVIIKSFIGYTGELLLDRSKPDGAPYKTVDGSLGKSLFGWSPEIGLKDGIKETVDWYMKQKGVSI